MTPPYGGKAKQEGVKRPSDATLATQWRDNPLRRKLIQSPFFSEIIYRIKIYIIQWQTQQILKTITPVLK
jgi:hypothetical protein